MSENKAREAVYSALEAVKGVPATAPAEASLTGDLGLESIDIVDLFFEIEQATGVVIELNLMVASVRDGAKRRFDEITIQDVVDYLAGRTPDPAKGD